jgi:hypothetical protein
MDFKNIHGTLFVSRVAFPPRAEATGFPSSREVFMKVADLRGGECYCPSKHLVTQILDEVFLS